MKPARPYGASAVWVMVWLAVVSCITASLCAQEGTAARHTGVSQDWSQRHIVFSRDGLAQHPDLLYREPRVLQQATQRWQAPNFGVFEGSESVPAPEVNTGLHRDWNLALGGHLVVNAYPSKFSFNPASPPDCTNDYVVFGLNTADTNGKQANLVALNNLYAATVANGGPGLCGTAPTVMFAYNITTVTGGHIITSPVISEDGLKIAFVESIPTNNGLGITAQSIFHVLTWTAGQGVIGGAVVPTNWVSIPLAGAKNDATSSPWVDYYSDTAYVGSANGQIYKITGVFRGTPTLAGTPWPVTVNTNSPLTSPVLDARLGMLMMGAGAANGNLYQVNIGSGAVAHVTVGAGSTRGILAAPIVDVSNGVTFVVSSDSTLTGSASAVLVEVDTATLAVRAAANIGQGSSGGTAVDLYQPALDNNYYNKPSTGSIHLCGTGPGDTTPWQYAFGFTVPGAQPILNTTALVKQQLPTTPVTSTGSCTGWTEFFNRNIGTGGTDYFFFGLNLDCTAAGGPGGCLEEIAINGGTPILQTLNIAGGPTGVIVDNYSTAAQASSIYFTSRTASTAYKFTQNGLQ